MLKKLKLDFHFLKTEKETDHVVCAAKKILKKIFWREIEKKIFALNFKRFFGAKLKKYSN